MIKKKRHRKEVPYIHLALGVRKLDSAIHCMDKSLSSGSITATNCVIQWIALSTVWINHYPVEVLRQPSFLVAAILPRQPSFLVAARPVDIYFSANGGDRLELV